VVDVEVDVSRGLMISSVSVITFEVPQTEEVHLEEPEVLDAVHLVLRDDRPQLRVLPAPGLRWIGR